MFWPLSLETLIGEEVEYLMQTIINEKWKFDIEVPMQNTRK